MHFCSGDFVESFIKDKTVALVGSGPGSLENEPGFVDSHDVVIRVNNYKTGENQGKRCDIFYSFFGKSIRKTSAELQADGVKLCMCKCPNAQFIESAWHKKNGKLNGVDFRYIYTSRADWWFCPTFVPSVEEFNVNFNLLGQHIPTTGFSALLDVLGFHPKSVYLTGFDFFISGIHNVDEPWRAKNIEDPFGHAPHRELQWVRENIDRLTVDKRLQGLL